jgi:hypothetical protein
MGKAMLFKGNRYEGTHEICAGPEGYQIPRDGVIVAQGIADIEAARAEVDRLIERWGPTGRFGLGRG